MAEENIGEMTFNRIFILIKVKIASSCESRIEFDNEEEQSSFITLRQPFKNKILDLATKSREKWKQLKTLVFKTNNDNRRIYLQSKRYSENEAKEECIVDYFNSFHTTKLSSFKKEYPEVSTEEIEKENLNSRFLINMIDNKSSEKSYFLVELEDKKSPEGESKNKERLIYNLYSTFILNERSIQSHVKDRFKHLILKSLKQVLMVLPKEGSERFGLDYRSSFDLFKDLEEFEKKEFIIKLSDKPMV